MVDRTDPGKAVFPSVIADFLERPDEVRKRLVRNADSYSDAFHQLTKAPTIRHKPLLDSNNLAAAVVTPQLDIIAQTAHFRTLDPELDVDPELVKQALLSRQAIIVPTSICATGKNQSALLIYGSADTVRNWHLPKEIAEAMDDRPDKVLVLTTCFAQDEAILRACASYGLTGLESRVVKATMEAGSIRDAATLAGVGYGTARETVSSALRKCGASRLPGMITKISLLALGILPVETSVEDLLCEQWGLSPRQAAIAVAIADGASREEVAKYIGMSLPTVKKELGAVFESLDISSAASLSRLISDFRAVASLAQSNGELLGYLDPIAEPLKIAPLEDGRSIAWSEYPGESDIPVLYVHSSMSTRIAPRSLVRQMQARGRRVISIDRPGFGMSDPLRDSDARKHFDLAARDCIGLLDKLRIGEIDVVSRGAAQFVIALAKLRPDLIRGAILVNPDPPTALDRRRHGPMGAFKEFYRKRPAIIRMAAQVIASNLTPARFKRVMEASMRGSPPDEKAIRDPLVLDDHYRSVRPFATGRIEGYVAEQIAFATMKSGEPLTGTRRWRVMLGQFDTLHDPESVGEYWRQMLPDADHEIVPDAGRLLLASHVDLVADRLEQMVGAT